MKNHHNRIEHHPDAPNEALSELRDVLLGHPFGLCGRQYTVVETDSSDVLLRDIGPGHESDSSFTLFDLHLLRSAVDMGEIELVDECIRPLSQSAPPYWSDKRSADLRRCAFAMHPAAAAGHKVTRL